MHFIKTLSEVWDCRVSSQFVNVLYFVLTIKHHYNTLEDLLLSNRNIKKIGWTQSDNTVTTISRYNYMFFYVFKMAVAIAFLCENAVEAI